MLVNTVSCYATLHPARQWHFLLSYKHASKALQTNRRLYNSFLAQENNDKNGCVRNEVWCDDHKHHYVSNIDRRSTCVSSPRRSYLLTSNHNVIMPSTTILSLVAVVALCVITASDATNGTATKVLRPPKLQLCILKNQHQRSHTLQHMLSKLEGELFGARCLDGSNYGTLRPIQHAWQPCNTNHVHVHRLLHFHQHLFHQVGDLHARRWLLCHQE